MPLKDNIKSYRIQKGLTLEELAQKVGVSRQTIQRYESGVISNIPSDNIEKMANALDVTPGNLMGWGQSNENNLPPLTPKDEDNIQKKLNSIIDDLSPDSGLAYFDGEEPLTDEDKELLRISLENSLRLAKQLAKQKFTPKKYRKE